MWSIYTLLRVMTCVIMCHVCWYGAVRRPPACRDSKGKSALLRGSVTELDWTYGPRRADVVRGSQSLTHRCRCTGSPSCMHPSWREGEVGGPSNDSCAERRGGSRSSSSDFRHFAGSTKCDGSAVLASAVLAIGLPRLRRRCPGVLILTVLIARFRRTQRNVCHNPCSVAAARAQGSRLGRRVCQGER